MKTSDGWGKSVAARRRDQHPRRVRSSRAKLSEKEIDPPSGC